MSNHDVSACDKVNLDGLSFVYVYTNMYEQPAGP